MNSRDFAFAGPVSQLAVSSHGSTFVSQRIGRKSCSLNRKKRYCCRPLRLVRYTAALGEADYLVDAEGSPFDMDDENIDLENVDFPTDIPLLNSVYLTGRLGADPVLRTIREGLDVCKFSLAVQHEYDPSFEQEDNTSWFDVEVWGNLGRSVSSRLKKGLRVGLSGSVDVSSWTNRDGDLVENPIITASTVEVLQSRSEAMPMPDGRMKSQSYEKDNSSFGTNSKYSGIQIDGDLKDLPF